MKTAFMFPGQGAQYVGMGRDLFNSVPDIAHLYRQANDIVGFDLAKLCFEGPDDQLDTTEISQPAIFVTSVACLTALRMAKVNPELAQITPDACLGLSLGEYTALYAGGAIDFDDALHLVHVRGKSMQQAAQTRKGAMVSVLGLDEEAVKRLCRLVLDDPPEEEDNLPSILAPVNFNCPGQIVISGSVNACRRAEQMVQRDDFGPGKAIPLRVAGAFHTQMMAPAAQRLAIALSQCKFMTPTCPVVANVDADVYGAAEQIPDKLLRQLTGAVRWQQSVEYLLDQKFDSFIEIGPGKVLTGLVKKIIRPRKQDVEIINISGLK